MELNNTYIPTLAQPALLYLDESPESEEAREAVTTAGIVPLHVFHDPADPPYRNPLVIHVGAALVGIEAIRGWLDALEGWAEKFPECELFENGADR